MRQAGIIAAGALYALEHHVDRLAEDHEHAKMLADAFAEHRGFSLESGPVETNLVWVRVDPSLGTAAEVAAYLRSRGILVAALGAQVIRACTHLDVARDDAAYAASVIRRDGTGHDHRRDAGVLSVPSPRPDYLHVGIISPPTLGGFVSIASTSQPRECQNTPERSPCFQAPFAPSFS